MKYLHEGKISGEAVTPFAGYLVSVRRRQDDHKSGGGGKTEAAHGLDHLCHHILGVAVDHVAVVGIEQRVDDAGVALPSPRLTT